MIRTATTDVSTEAVVLLSGGLDSATCLALATTETDSPDTIQPVFIWYGQQTAEVEHQQARALAEQFKTRNPLVLDIRDSVSGYAEGVASDRDSFRTDDGEYTMDDGRSTGYVPVRNLLLLSLAGGVADSAGATTIYFGAQGGDRADYPDCRPAFVEAANRALDHSVPDATSLAIRTPLLDASKTEVIERAARLDVPFEHTYSCYAATDPDDPEPCGDCPACIERREAFENADIEQDDPFVN